MRRRSGHTIHPLPAAGRSATVDVQDLTCDECRLFQIQNGVEDISRLPHSPHRLQAGKKLVRLWRMQRCFDNARRDRVYANTPASVFDGERTRHRIEAALCQSGKRRAKRSHRLLRDRRRDVDDMPGAVLQRPGCGLLRDVEEPGQIDSNRLASNNQ